MAGGQEILGGGPFRHHRDVRQAFRAVLQCDEMPMDRDTLDAQAVRALQNGGIARIRIRVPIGMEEAPGSTSSPCSQP